MSAVVAITGFAEGARFGGYRLVKLLGRGGFAQVWLAIEEGPHGFEKPVALKVLTRGGRDRSAWQTLINEARVGSRLRHPNIVDIYRIAEIDGTWHIAMEYVEGQDIDGLVGRARALDLVLPSSVILEIGREVARALDYAHHATDHAGNRLNLVHRDLKPANVLIGRRGTVKVADFGIAKAAVSLETTTAGILKGTPYYMAPEIWAGERTFHPRLDLFALGVMLAEMALGEHLFKGATPAAVASQVLFGSPEEEAAMVAETAPELTQVLVGLLQRKPDERTGSAAVVADSLQRARAGMDAPGDLALYLELLEIAHAPPAERTARLEGRVLPDTDASGWKELVDLLEGRAVEAITSRWRPSPLLEMLGTGREDPDQLEDTTSLSELVDEDTLRAHEPFGLVDAETGPRPIVDAPPAGAANDRPALEEATVEAEVRRAPERPDVGPTRAWQAPSRPRWPGLVVAGLVLAAVGLASIFGGGEVDGPAPADPAPASVPEAVPVPVSAVEVGPDGTADPISDPAGSEPAPRPAVEESPPAAPAAVSDPVAVAPAVEDAVAASAAPPRAASVEPVVEALVASGPGCLVFQSMPPGAAVRIDGATTGLYARSGDRVRRSYAAGSVSVLMGQGGAEASAVVEVTSGQRQVVHCSLVAPVGCTVRRAEGGCS